MMIDLIELDLTIVYTNDIEFGLVFLVCATTTKLLLRITLCALKSAFKLCRFGTEEGARLASQCIGKRIEIRFAFAQRWKLVNFLRFVRSLQFSRTADRAEKKHKKRDSWTNKRATRMLLPSPLQSSTYQDLHILSHH